MSNAHLQSVLTMLPKLNEKELNTVRQMIERLSLTPMKPPDLSEDQLLLLDAITHVWGEIYGKGSPYLSKSAMKSFRENSDVFFKFCSTYFPKTESKNEKLRLYRILIRCEITYLRSIKLSINPVTICRNLTNITPAFDKSFPGYMASGCQHLLYSKG